MFYVFIVVFKMFVANFANKLGRLGRLWTVSPVVLESGREEESPVAILAHVRPGLVAVLRVLLETFLAREPFATSFTVSAALIVTGWVLQKGVLTVEYLVARIAMKMASRHNAAVNALYMRLHPLIIIALKLTNYAIKQLDSQAILSPSLRIIQWLFIQEADPWVVDVLGVAIAAVKVWLIFYLETDTIHTDHLNIVLWVLSKDSSPFRNMSVVFFVLQTDHVLIFRIWRVQTRGRVFWSLIHLTYRGLGRSESVGHKTRMWVKFVNNLIVSKFSLAVLLWWIAVFRIFCYFYFLVLMLLEGFVITLVLCCNIAIYRVPGCCCSFLLLMITLVWWYIGDARVLYIFSFLILMLLKTLLITLVLCCISVARVPCCCSTLILLLVTLLVIPYRDWKEVEMLTDVLIIHRTQWYWHFGMCIDHLTVHHLMRAHS